MKRFLSCILICVLLATTIVLTSCGLDGIYFYRLNGDRDGYVISAVIKGKLIVVQGDIIPESYNGLPVTEIAQGGFAGWEYLFDITIPGCVEKIGTYAFGSSGLVLATVEEGTRIIGDYAFTNSQLNEISLPESIEYIGAGAFGNCQLLTLINYSGTVAQWNDVEKGDGWCAFTGGDEGILSISCSDGVLSILTE